MTNDNTEATPEESVATDDASPYRATKIMLSIIILLLIWYLFADRITPYSAAARFQAFVIPVVPDVSGYIENIPVSKYTLAKAGDTLLEIESRRFELAVQSSEASLEVAGQEVGAGTAGVASATAKLTEAQVALDEARTQAKRVFTLEVKGVYSEAQGDQARSIVATAEARLGAAEADLEQQKRALGAVGEANPRVQLAMVNLEQAQLDLARTSIRAHTQGYIGSLYIDEGAFATAGQPVMTFITLDDFWIEASMTENNLGRMKPGNKVEIVFDVLPGRVFKGKVKKIAPGVSTGKQSVSGQLSVAQKTSGWLRSPQRFAVVIETVDYEHDPDVVRIRHNSQVDVIVYTGDGWFWNTLGKLWIRLMSVLSYAY